jgi:hypothetical protein
MENDVKREDWLMTIVWHSAFYGWRTDTLRFETEQQGRDWWLESRARLGRGASMTITYAP